MPYRLELLGRAELRDEHGLDVGGILAQPKRLGLLTYLTIATPRGFHRRDVLLSLLWPDVPESRGRNALRQALFHLREHMPGALISRQDGAIAIAPGTITCDVHDFEAAAQRRDASAVGALYGGDLIPAFSIGDAEPFNEWLEDRRAELRALYDRRSGSSPTAAPTPTRDKVSTIAVEPFTNLNADAAHENFARIAADAALAGAIDTRLVTVAANSRESPGLRISGSYRKDGEQLRVHARLEDVAAGRILGVIDDLLVSPAQITSAAEELRRRVGGLVASHSDRRVESWASAVARAPTLDHHREYTMGIERHLAGDYATAVRHFVAATDVEKGFTVPLIWAIQACCNAADYSRASDILSSLAAHRLTLSPAEQLTCDYFGSWLEGDRGGALRILKRIAELVPETEVLSQLGRDALLCNHPRYAVEVLGRANPERGWLPGWVPYWRRLTEAYHALGEHAAELEAAQLARRLHPQSMSTILLEARAWAGAGNVEEVARVCDDAMSMADDAFTTVGDVLVVASRELRAHGRGEASAALVQAAADWAIAAPDKCRSTARAAFYDARRFDELVPLLDDEPESVGYRSLVAAHRGQQAAARGGMLALRKLSGRERYGSHLAWAARVAARIGQHDDAIQFLRGAFARGMGYGVDIHADPDLGLLSEHRAFRDLMRPRG
jgi:tetratricopeptide (TPR) repeat protein